MIRTIPLFVLMANPVLACDLTSTHVIAYTHHLGAEPVQTEWTNRGERVYGPRFDEGWGIRGGGITVDCSGYEITASAYKNSLHDGGNGYSLSVTHDAMSYMVAGVDIRPIAQINYYPDQRDNPAMQDGWFPSFGIKFHRDLGGGFGVFVNAYPALGSDKSFDSLWVGGLTVKIGG